MDIDEVKEKIRNQIIDFGNGPLEFETSEIAELLHHIRNIEVKYHVLEIKLEMIQDVINEK